MDAVVREYMDDFSCPAAAVAWLDRDHGHWINGEMVEAAPAIDLIEPWTGGRLGSVADGDQSVADHATSAARSAFETGDWSRMGPLDRQRLILALADALRRDADIMAHCESISVGKNISEAREIDVAGSVANLEYFAGWAGRTDGRVAETVGLPGRPFAFTVKDPIGVVAAMVPWNFPLQTLVWKLGAALASGCTLVCKPSELTPQSALRLAWLATEVGFPPGVINVVNGRGAGIGQMLATHPGIDKVTFTGSTPVGISVGQTALSGMKALTLELGGKSPVIVSRDADLDKAVAGVIGGIFLNSGQCCDAGSRVYVEDAAHDRFVDLLVARVGAMRCGPGLDPNSEITPLISAAHRDRVLGHVAQAKAEGALQVTGETGPCSSDTTRIVRPTVFTGCRDDMHISQTEVFGPVLGIDRVASVDEAIMRANASAFGLASAVYTENLSEALTVARRLRAGNVYVNAHGLLDPALPFGGRGMSGFGKDMGPEQLESYLVTRSIYMQVA